MAPNPKRLEPHKLPRILIMQFGPYCDGAQGIESLRYALNGARSMDRMRLPVELLLVRGYFTDLMSSTEMMDSTDMTMAIGKI